MYVESKCQTANTWFELFLTDFITFFRDVMLLTIWQNVTTPFHVVEEKSIGLLSLTLALSLIKRLP